MKSLINVNRDEWMISVVILTLTDSST